VKVREVMSTEVVTAKPTATVQDIASLMSKHDVGTVLITDEGGKLHGLVTDRDVVTECVGKGHNPATCKVDEVMTGKGFGPIGNLVTASPDEDVMDAIRRLGDKEVRRMPVVQDDRVVGIVSVADMARELQDAVSGFFEEVSKSAK
jgi:CBS domain-containing protein